ncbi:hypothetical protein AC1031_004601 [Aphanomyces cochlioides]|nr:hypothetical protein AC1031_004601 [Aphanomyces cochlioides]
MLPTATQQMNAGWISKKQSRPWIRCNVLVSAPTGRDPKCRACSVKIDDVRVGIIYKHELLEHICVQWFHLACVAPPPHLLASDVEGLNEVAMKPYRAAVFDWLIKHDEEPTDVLLPPATIDLDRKTPSPRECLVAKAKKPPLAPSLPRPSRMLPKGVVSASKQSPGVLNNAAMDAIATMKACLADPRHTSTRMMS